MKILSCLSVQKAGMDRTRFLSKKERHEKFDEMFGNGPTLDGLDAMDGMDGQWIPTKRWVSLRSTHPAIQRSWIPAFA